MPLPIIFKVLIRNALLPALLMVQMVLACAILSNVLFLAWQRLEPMLAPSGLDEKNLILADQINSQGQAWTQAEVEAGTLALRHVAGVQEVSAAFGLPMVRSAIVDYALQGPSGRKVGVNGYMGRGLVKTLGLRLISGRDFSDDDYRVFNLGGPTSKGGVIPIIVTKSLADVLFGGDALGKIVRDPQGGEGATSYQVVGVVRHLLRNQLDLINGGRADFSILLPEEIGSTTRLSFAIRTDPAMRATALLGARRAILRSFGDLVGPNSSPSVDFYESRAHTAYRGMRASLWLLAGVSLAVGAVVLMGTVGLTGFWVQRRSKQIGIYRALGARRADILLYFLKENLLIVSSGCVAGMLAGYGLNAFLMDNYEMGRLPWIYLPMGSALMLLFGQLASLLPAFRAMSVSPMTATKAS